jgi:kynurenine formamidase
MGAAHDGGPVHIAALKQGAVFVEGRAHLQALPPQGAFFLFLPIKVRASTGGCGRAVALLA